MFFKQLYKCAAATGSSFCRDISICDPAGNSHCLESHDHANGETEEHTWGPSVNETITVDRHTQEVIWSPIDELAQRDSSGNTHVIR
jgi:hypothetical protein